MGRYFFHIKAQGHSDPDDTGVELPDAEAAFEEAVKAARDAALSGRDISGQSFEVTDAKGEPVFTLPFSLATEDRTGENTVSKLSGRPFGHRPKRKPGAACEYLASRDIALIGDTSANDAQSSGEGGTDFAVPCHTENQTRRGIWNLENVDTTRECSEPGMAFLYLFEGEAFFRQ